MLNNRIRNLVNQQINTELVSAYLYHNISLRCTYLGLHGFASWYRLQELEELDHARKFEKYLLDNNEQPTMLPIETRNDLPSDVTQLLELALQQEQKVTSDINTIYNCAIEYNDVRTMSFLNWFVDEQLEEEVNATDNLQMLRNFATCSGGLLEVDSRLGNRESA